MSIESRLLAFVRSRGLILPNDRVLVALSGGVDSVVLLHLLRTLLDDLQIELAAAHFDHAMHASSAADAEWVSELCDKLRVPLVQARAREPLRSEAAARSERYAFLQHAMRDVRAQRVATAHHADDQIETVLFRVLRGAGLRGLSGIPVRRGPFIRPLLRFFKRDLIAYAEKHELPFRPDPTNAQLHFVRNRIRHTLLPPLEEISAQAKPAVLALARHAAQMEKAWHAAMLRMEKELITSNENQRIELARDVLLEYDPALRARMIRHLLRRFGAVPSRASTRHILNFCSNSESGTVLEVAGRARIERAFDTLRIEGVRRAAATDTTALIAGPEGNAEISIGGVSYDVAWTFAPSKDPAAEVFDGAVLNDGLELRGWRSGDRIQLAYGTKKLKKLFGERRIAASDRKQLPILVDDRGRVLWVPGVARSVHAVPSDGPTLNIVVKHAELG